MLVIGAAFAVLLIAVARLRDTAANSLESQRVLVSANTLERLVVDLETGSRGYIITGDLRFLAPWDAARRALPAQSSELVRLARVHAQDVRARQIAASIAAYVRDYSVPLVDAVKAHAGSVRSVATTEEGKRRVDVIRARFDRFTAAERQLASARQDRAGAAEHWALIAVIAGLSGSVLLILLYAGDVVRSIVRPVVAIAGMAGRLARGDLVVRTPENGTGEIGALQRAFNHMARSLAASSDELRLLADEQAALRRVATLVARVVPPAELFAAAAAEVRLVLDADATTLLRYEDDGTATVIGGQSVAPMEIREGMRFPVQGRSVTAMVLRTGRPARIDGYEGVGGPLAEMARRDGLRCSVGAPVTVEGNLWGVMIANWREDPPRSSGIQARMAQFTELVATAIANAQSRAQLSASRARLVTAGDDARRRIERDLHDGTQQRLVSLALELRGAEAIVPPQQEELKAQLDRVTRGLVAATEELQQLSRGIHPAILSEGGLEPALKTLARRSAVPVELDVRSDRRLPAPAEVAAYYVVSEALANAAKHASASVVHVDVVARDSLLDVSIHDDGVGGADTDRGSGLIGLADRVEALGGELTLASPAAGGTSLRARIPIEAS
jgi:signal transduction histidine kinase